MTADEDQRRPAAARVARRELLDLHAKQGVATERVSFRTWVPNSARRRRKRLFVGSYVDDKPCYVAKVPLSDEDDMLTGEWRALTALSVTPTAFPRPEPVAQLSRGFAMSYLLACDFPDALANAAPPQRAALLMSGVDVILAVQRSGPPGADPVEVAAGYTSLAGLDPAARDALTRVPVGPAHGDLGPWNLRVGGDGAVVGALDWEDYRSSGLPVLDVLNLVFTAALIWFAAQRDRGHEWLFAQVFQAETEFRAVSRRAIARYATQTGCQPADVFALFPLFCCWMVTRIRAQGRPTAHLFYEPFLELFRAGRPTWTGVADA